MSDFIIEENFNYNSANIKAIGVGGGGGNMVNHMVREGITGVEMIVANTDTQALRNSLAHTKIQLGERLTRGLGAGGIPEKGQKSADESFEEVKSSLEGADIVFISAGLGGGTGTGAAPVVARAAKEVDALTISIATKPFRFEGKKRARLADMGLQALKEESDAVIIIPNEKILGIVERTLGTRDAFKIVDKILAQAVSGMTNIILSNGENDINIDFADVQSIMSHKGMALMGVGEFKGSDAAMEASKMATQSPLFDNMTINGALGILVHFQMHPEYPMIGMSEAMEYIEDSVDEEASVIFGTTYNESLEVDDVKVTIIATGFEKNQPVNDTKPVTTPTQEAAQPAIQENSAPKTHTIKITNMDQILGSNSSTNGAKVVGGDFDDDLLDLPPFMRHQLD
jgi:cell division protein FtsZ